jgi:hypothetical protein
MRLRWKNGCGAARSGLPAPIPAAGVLAALLAVGQPALAATDSGQVIATVEVTAGGIFISAPAELDLGVLAYGAEVSTPFGAVTVTDERGAAAAAWSVTGSATDFLGGGADPGTVPAASVRYWSGPATRTAGLGDFQPGQEGPDEAVPLGDDQIAFQLVDGAGGNAATWNPTLILRVPLSAVADTYQGTVTHSVTA